MCLKKTKGGKGKVTPTRQEVTKRFNVWVIYVCKMSMGLGYDPKGHIVKLHGHF